MYSDKTYLGKDVLSTVPFFTYKLDKFPTEFKLMKLIMTRGVSDNWDYSLTKLGFA